MSDRLAGRGIVNAVAGPAPISELLVGWAALGCVEKFGHAFAPRGPDSALELGYEFLTQWRRSGLA
jgi:hypothetical protein